MLTLREPSTLPCLPPSVPPSPSALCCRVCRHSAVKQRNKQSSGALHDRLLHVRSCKWHAASRQQAASAAPTSDLSQASHAPFGVVLDRSLQVASALIKLWLLNQGSSTTPTHHEQSQGDYNSAVQQLLSDLGPLWVKLGQTLAVRPDVVGHKLASALSGLQEAAPPFPNSTAAAIVEAELGLPPSVLFAVWPERPVASASLGQVYKTTLRGRGTLVAVKVQRPGLLDQISLDLAILRQLLRVLRWLGRIQQDITLWATTLSQGLAQELDYVQEAANLAEFAAAHAYLGFVDTPSVIWPLTSTRVLTTTWVEGHTPGQLLRALGSGATNSSSSSSSTPTPLQQQEVPAASVHTAQQQQQQRAVRRQQLLQLVDLGVAASLHQLVVTGVVHADPHPGNLLLSEGRLVYLDFGLLVRVPPEASLAMMSALLHWSQAQWLGLAQDMRQMGLLKPTTDLQELAGDLQARFQALHDAAAAAAGSERAAAAPGAAGSEQAAALASHMQGRAAASGAAAAGGAPALLQAAGSIGFGQFAGVVAALALKYRFELPPYYTLVIRSLTTLEGFALMVDPAARYSLARTAVKVIASHLLCDTRPAAHQLLRELLLSPPDQQAAAGRLNLPLLQDLLQLTLNSTPQHATQSAAGLSHTTFSTGSSQQLSPAKLNTSPGPMQLLDPVVLCEQQLGLSVPAVAAQLVGGEAAPIRALLAQLLLQRWQTGRTTRQRLFQVDETFSLKAKGRASSGVGVAAPTAGAAVVSGGHCQCTSANAPEAVATATSVGAAAGSMLGRTPSSGMSQWLQGRPRWLVWLRAAGVPGVQLMLQLAAAVVVLLAKQAVMHACQCVRHLTAVVAAYVGGLSTRCKPA